jgi:putative flippase GtrA
MTSPTDLVAQLKGEYGQKAAKYAAVSVFNVLFGQGLLVLANHVFEWSFVWSNVFAVSISAFPAYVLSRRWIWQKKGNNHFWKEVVPFWAMAFFGLGLSTLFAYIAAQISDATIVLQLANLSAFGILWVAKFFVLDKLLFNTDDEPRTDTALDALVDEVIHHHHPHQPPRPVDAPE